MRFYDEIANYYDDIFIPNENQVHFLKTVIGPPSKEVLDIACGTGGYALILSQYGYSVLGIDLDKKMIEKAKQKALNIKQNIEFHVENMLNFKINNTFDTIYCIGNSLVHLKTFNDIKHFFKHIKRRLKPLGKIVIQIINYDRILKYGIDQLPTIYNEQKKLKFTRHYHYHKEKHKISFHTVLSVNNKTITNSIDLLPITSIELEDILRNEGYKEIKMYGDFLFAKYQKDYSYALILTASY